MAATSPFDRLLTRNEEYATTHRLAAETGVAQEGLAIVTCIDSRLDPLRIFGLEPGDSKIIRNAGARITPDALRSLALSVAALGVDHIAVVPHTRCKMTELTQEEAAAAVAEASGNPTGDFDFCTVPDQIGTLQADVELLRNSPLIADSVVVGGFLLDLDTGLLKPIC